MITCVNPIIVYFTFPEGRTQACRDLAARIAQPCAALPGEKPHGHLDDLPAAVRAAHARSVRHVSKYLL